MLDVRPEIDRALAELNLAEVEEDIRVAMLDVQPDIERAVAEAMTELGVAAPHIVPRPTPTPTPAPTPRPRR